MEQQVITFNTTKVKYVKVSLTKLNKLPSWHGSKGKPAWVMVSEIVVN